MQPPNEPIIFKPKGAPTKKNATRYWALPFTPSLRAQAAKMARDPAFTAVYTDEHGRNHTVSTRQYATADNRIAQVHTANMNAILVTHAASFGRGDLQAPQYWFMDLSHTCGITFCLDHFLWELPPDNTARDLCLLYNHFSTCPHTPVECMLPPADLGRARSFLDKAIEARIETERAATTTAQQKKSARNTAYYNANRGKLSEKSKQRNRQLRGTKEENFRVPKDNGDSDDGDSNNGDSDDEDGDGRKRKRRDVENRDIPSTTATSTTTSTTSTTAATTDYDDYSDLLVGFNC